MFNRILIGRGRKLRTAGFVVAMAGLAVNGSVRCDAVGVNDVVMEWNQTALAATVTAGQGPVPQIRSMTIVQVSVHDAVNTISAKHSTYLAAGPAPAGASAEAAAIAAAHRALVTLFPLQAPAFDAARAASLAARGLTEADAGIGVGESAAAAILGARSSDGAAQAQFPYTAPAAGTPGVWVTVGSAPALLPGWGRVATWILPSGAQFRPDGPPALSSGRYARDYREVQQLGSATSATRTAEQTDIARFWLAPPSPIWNGVARQIIAARGLDVSDSAKVLALMYLASSDASVACWDAKYTFNFWRPMAAIRNGDLDGNDATVGDPVWQPLFPTPPHPEYLSGHSTNSSAMAAILAFLFGDDPGVPIVAISPTNPGFPRRWATFSDGVDEVIEARIYAGIHYRTSDEEGARVGRQVARFVINHALR
jgi:PAP2 superfamily